MIVHQPSGDTGSAKRWTCTERITIPTFNAEFIPEQDGGPCQRPAVVRVSIEHDGDLCGCLDGLCLASSTRTPATTTSPPGPRRCCCAPTTPTSTATCTTRPGRASPWRRCHDRRDADPHHHRPRQVGRCP